MIFKEPLSVTLPWHHVTGMVYKSSLLFIYFLILCTFNHFRCPFLSFLFSPKHYLYFLAFGGCCTFQFVVIEIYWKKWCCKTNFGRWSENINFTLSTLTFFLVSFSLNLKTYSLFIKCVVFYHTKCYPVFHVIKLFKTWIR